MHAGNVSRGRCVVTYSVLWNLLILGADVFAVVKEDLHGSNVTFLGIEQPFLHAVWGSVSVSTNTKGVVW
jgi:hypothetical protein